MVEEVALPMLVALAPLLILYLIGAVLALMWLSRHRLSAWLLLAGCVLLLVTLVAHTVVLEQLIAWEMSRDGTGPSALNLEQAHRWLAALSTLGNMAGIGLLIAAALVGRGAGRPATG